MDLGVFSLAVPDGLTAFRRGIVSVRGLGRPALWPALSEVGIDSDESELQASFDQPSEVFQAAAEDPTQTHIVFYAPAISRESGFSLSLFSSS